MIFEVAYFAYKIDFAAEMGASRVDTVAMSINPAFPMLLRRERRSITR